MAGEPSRPDPALAETNPALYKEQARAWRQYIGQWQNYVESQLKYGASLSDLGITPAHEAGQAGYNKYNYLYSNYGNVDPNYRYDWVNGVKYNIGTSDQSAHDRPVPITAQEWNEFHQQQSFGTHPGAYVDRMQSEQKGWLERAFQQGQVTRDPRYPNYYWDGQNTYFDAYGAIVDPKSGKRIGGAYGEPDWQPGGQFAPGGQGTPISGGGGSGSSGYGAGSYGGGYGGSGLGGSISPGGLLFGSPSLEGLAANEAAIQAELARQGRLDTLGKLFEYTRAAQQYNQALPQQKYLRDLYGSILGVKFNPGQDNSAQWFSQGANASGYQGGVPGTGAYSPYGFPTAQPLGNGWYKDPSTGNIYYDPNANATVSGGGRVGGSIPGGTPGPTPFTSQQWGGGNYGNPSGGFTAGNGLGPGSIQQQTPASPVAASQQFQNAGPSSPIQGPNLATQVVGEPTTKQAPPSGGFLGSTPRDWSGYGATDLPVATAGYYSGGGNNGSIGPSLSSLSSLLGNKEGGVGYLGPPTPAVNQAKLKELEAMGLKPYGGTGLIGPPISADRGGTGIPGGTPGPTGDRGTTEIPGGGPGPTLDGGPISEEGGFQNPGGLSTYLKLQGKGQLPTNPGQNDFPPYGTSFLTPSGDGTTNDLGVAGTTGGAVGPAGVATGSPDTVRGPGVVAKGPGQIVDPTANQMNVGGGGAGPGQTGSGNVDPNTGYAAEPVPPQLWYAWVPWIHAHPGKTFADFLADSANSDAIFRWITDQSAGGQSPNGYGQSVQNWFQQQPGYNPDPAYQAFIGYQSSQGSGYPSQWYRPISPDLPAAPSFDQGSYELSGDSYNPLDKSTWGFLAKPAAQVAGDADKAAEQIRQSLPPGGARDKALAQLAQGKFAGIAGLRQDLVNSALSGISGLTETGLGYTPGSLTGGASTLGNIFENRYNTNVGAQTAANSLAENARQFNIAQQNQQSNANKSLFGGLASTLGNLFGSALKFGL